MGLKTGGLVENLSKKQISRILPTFHAHGNCPFPWQKIGDLFSGKGKTENLQTGGIPDTIEDKGIQPETERLSECLQTEC